MTLVVLPSEPHSLFSGTHTEGIVTLEVLSWLIPLPMKPWVRECFDRFETFSLFSANLAVCVY